MNKRTLTFLFFLCSILSFSQNKKEIDDNFLKENNKQLNSDYLNIYFSSKDCYRCSGEIHLMLSEIAKENLNIEVNILTDQVLFARKETSSYPFKINYFVNKDVFKEKPVSFFYLKSKDSIIDDYQKIMAKLKSYGKKIPILSAHESLKSFQVVDSSFSPENLFSSGIYQNNIIFYDNVMNLGGIINYDSNNLKHYNLTQSSKKIYDLPLVFQFENRELLPHDDFLKMSQESKSTEIKLNVVTVFENMAYSQFTISKLFRNLEKEDSFDLISFGYIALKEIKDDEKLSNIFDLETYDSYINTDQIIFEKKPYRLGLAIYHPFVQIINKHQFITNIYRDTDYIGEATFDLSKDLQKLSISKIDLKVEVKYIYPNIIIDDDLYYLNKEMLDELTGEGIITLKKRTVF